MTPVKIIGIKLFIAEIKKHILIPKNSFFKNFELQEIKETELSDSNIANTKDIPNAISIV